jgi:hypothetical protein
MSDQNTAPPITDTPPSQQKVSWAAAVSFGLGLLAIAPEAAQHLLPFVAEKDRPRVLAFAALCSLLAGQLLNRKATSNLAGYTLPLAPRMAQAERKAVAAEVKAEQVAENLAQKESGLTADLIARGTGNAPPPSTPGPGLGTQLREIDG